ncbi:MAG: cytosine permease [Sphingomonadaceae bacterium]
MPERVQPPLSLTRGNDPSSRPGVSQQGEDFALDAVPDHAVTAAYKIGIMLLAANISLPALIMGGQLGVERGFAGAAIACFWGGLVLAALAGVCAYVGARSRLTTYVLIMRAFGERGGAWINFLLSWSAIGWFGVVLMLFADTMVRMTAGTIPIWAVGGLLLMAYTTIIGFRALQWLSNVMLPAKFGLLIWAIWAAVRIHGNDFLTPIPERATLDARTAISFVVGGWVVGAVVAPDFARYARNAGRAGFACAFALGVGYPLVLLAAAIPAILTGERDMLTTMANLGMGTAALAIVLFASWTNGANNLYSGSLMLATVFRRRRRASLIWAAGGLGMIIGLAGITGAIIPYLSLLSLIVPPVAGVYLPRFFLDQRHGAPLPSQAWQPDAFAAMAMGIAVGGFGQASGHSISGIIPIDSLTVSAVSYLGLQMLRRRPIRFEPASG